MKHLTSHSVFDTSTSLLVAITLYRDLVTNFGKPETFLYIPW